MLLCPSCLPKAPSPTHWRSGFNTNFRGGVEGHKHVVYSTAPWKVGKTCFQNPGPGVLFESVALDYCFDSLNSYC